MAFLLFSAVCDNNNQTPKQYVNANVDVSTSMSKVNNASILYTFSCYTQFFYLKAIKCAVMWTKHIIIDWDDSRGQKRAYSPAY